MITYPQLWQSLAPLYPNTEAQAIVRLLLETLHGFTLTDIVCGAVERLPPSEEEALMEKMGRLQEAEPIQYVLGEAQFCRRTFHVESGVLIPRPETEELVSLVEEEEAHDILDICTGSGCIAISLALDIKGSNVEAWDISEDALRIARDNARRLGAEVRFEERDALQLVPDTARWDCIVSNPPYICEQEKATMANNVLCHEPSTALFVPDDDPLRFYRAIAQYAQASLRPGGTLFFEINPLYAEELRVMLEGMHFQDMTFRKDAQGKLRMARARKNS